MLPVILSVQVMPQPGLKLVSHHISFSPLAIGYLNPFKFISINILFFLPLFFMALHLSDPQLFIFFSSLQSIHPINSPFSNLVLLPFPPILHLSLAFLQFSCQKIQFWAIAADFRAWPCLPNDCDTLSFSLKAKMVCMLVQHLP
jgi:hypothetical protein